MHLAYTLEEYLAVIVAVPAAFAVTFPLESTTATDGLPELHVIFPAAFDGDREYVSFALRPFTRVMADAFNLIALGAGALTVTLQTAFFPFEVFTVIVAVPAFFAVTVPLEFTEAILGLLLVHVYTVPAPDGFTDALSVKLFPIMSSAFVLFSVTEEGSLGTVTVHLA